MDEIIPEAYDITPPWEKKEKNEFAAVDPPDSLSRKELIQLGSGRTVVGYEAGLSEPNQNVFLGYRAGPSAFIKMVTSVRDSEWFDEQTGKMARTCPQCGQLLREAKNCYICFACGSTYAIEED